MKRILITTICAIISVTLLNVVQGQGKIGLLTDSPDAPVHIASSGQVNIPGGLMLLGNRAEGHMEVDFNLFQSRFGATNYLPMLIQPNGGNLNVGSGLIFADRTNKWIGINTASPNTELSVHGEMGMTTSGLNVSKKDKVSIHGGLEQSLTVGLGWIKNESIVGGLSGSSLNRSNQATTYDIYYKSQGAHRWFINEDAVVANSKMILSNDGYLGIGTPSPLAKLHIPNGDDASLLNNGYIMLGTPSGTNLVFDNNEILSRDNNNFSEMHIQRDGGDLLLCAFESGQVGIGIQNSANLPDSTYLLAVDGKILSEEVRVELSGDWPDYVFEEEYKLLPLEKLANQIEELGHLPGIPSAQKVKKEGFELGEMQRKLLEKVEELTLHVIELDRTNQILMGEIEKLKNSKTH